MSEDYARLNACIDRDFFILNHTTAKGRAAEISKRVLSEATVYAAEVFDDPMVQNCVTHLYESCLYTLYRKLEVLFETIDDVKKTRHSEKENKSCAAQTSS